MHASLPGPHSQQRGALAPGEVMASIGGRVGEWQVVVACFSVMHLSEADA